VELRPGQLRLSIENHTDRRVLPALLGFQRRAHHLLAKRRPFLTAKRLLTNQTFRDLFNTDTLDLKGSTALYERVGDLVAYDLVRQHFGVLHEIVAAEAGCASRRSAML
jgi:class 3 adenylate cyclase